MKIKTRYIVIKSSDDGTFLKGDHIYLNEDGSISCLEASGWIDKENVEEATKGMEMGIDKEYYRNIDIKLKKFLKGNDDILQGM